MFVQQSHSDVLISFVNVLNNSCVVNMFQDIPEVVNTYCNSNISLDVMCHYRIVLATCMTSGLLYNLGIKPGHFTHVFIDEVCKSDLSFKSGQIKSWSKSFFLLYRLDRQLNLKR